MSEKLKNHLKGHKAVQKQIADKKRKKTLGIPLNKRQKIKKSNNFPSGFFPNQSEVEEKQKAKSLVTEEEALPATLEDSSESVEEEASSSEEIEILKPVEVEQPKKVNYELSLPLTGF